MNIQYAEYRIENIHPHDTASNRDRILIRIPCARRESKPGAVCSPGIHARAHIFQAKAQIDNKRSPYPYPHNMRNSFALTCG